MGGRTLPNAPDVPVPSASIIFKRNSRGTDHRNVWVTETGFNTCSHRDIECCSKTRNALSVITSENTPEAAPLAKRTRLNVYGEWDDILTSDKWLCKASGTRPVDMNPVATL
jgi:hypothetical protein